MVMRGIIFVALGTIAASACNAEPSASANQVKPTNEAIPAPAPPVEGKPVELKSETPLLSWEASWPAEVNAIPALEKLIREPAEKALADYTREARQQKAEREKEGYDFNPYMYALVVEVAGQTQRLLSLTRSWSEYAGGAHPNRFSNGVLWDRAQGKAISFADLLTGGSAAVEPLFARTFCRGLNEQRREKRGPENFSTGPDDPFTKCPAFNELSIIPQGETGKPLTTILIHADPYVAGPYVEGDYDVEIPVTERLLAALKSEYRASFADPR
jgi:hypothetical protein